MSDVVIKAPSKIGQSEVIQKRDNDNWAILLLVGVLLAGLSGCAGLPMHSDATNMIQLEEVAVGLLVVAAVVSLITQRLRIPYTIGLVLVGLGLAILVKIPNLPVLPEIILALLVPPLVFDAAFHLNFNDLRRELPLLILLTVPGVILTTLLVGGILSLSAGINLTTALVFGALISATDPVAVVALFRSLGVPKRLQVLLEGESLLNDGTAIVLFNLMTAIALTGRFNLAEGLLQFLLVAGGGILVGTLGGVIVSNLIGQIDDYLIETTLTTVLAYGVYLLAEYLLGVSGVLAVVAAGLASGQIGPRGMSPTTRIVVSNFWEYAAFLANSFVFLIIGLQMDIQLLVSNAPAIAWAILAVLAARAITIYGLSWLGKGIPLQWMNVLFWGGLRGAISLALALSLSPSLPDRSQLQAMAFGVVLFTLLVEGLSMKPLIRRAGLNQFSPARLAYEQEHARAIALQAATNHLSGLNRSGLISDYTWQRLKPVLESQSSQLAGSIHQILEREPDLHLEELTDAWREALRAQRSTLNDLFRDHVVPEEVFAKLAAEIDFQLIDTSLPELEPAPGSLADPMTTGDPLNKNE